MIDFMRDVLTMIFKWMDLFPNLAENYYGPVEELGLPQIHSHALALCGPEFLEILGKCFGTCMRTNNFMAQFEPQKPYD